MFHHLGKTLTEILWLPNLNAVTLASTTTFEGLENLPVGQGAIGITAHCGNWEWVAHAIAQHMPLTVLHRERDEAEMNDFATKLRNQNGIATIDRGVDRRGKGDDPRPATRQPPRIFDRSEHPFREHASHVLAVPLRLPSDRQDWPCGWAYRSFAFSANGAATNCTSASFEPILAGPDDDAAAITARLTADIEEQIRRVPEQWV